MVLVTLFSDQAIRIAIDGRVPNVLPIAYYELAMSFTRTDRADATLTNLTMDNMNVMQKGLRRMYGFFGSTTGPASKTAFQLGSRFRCPNKLDCRHELEELMGDLPIGYGHYGFDPIAWLKDKGDDLTRDASRLGVCHNCAVFMVLLLTAHRLRLWGELRNAFEVKYTVSNLWHCYCNMMPWAD